MSSLDRPPAATAPAPVCASPVRNLIGRFFVAGATALLVACGGGSGPGPAPAPATSASAVIGAAGGTLTGPDGVQVVIPPGALSADTTIGIARSSAGAPAALADTPIAGSPYEFTPHDLVFNLPVTIRMPLPSGADGSALFMASPGEDWQAIDATVSAGVAEWTRNSFSFGYAGLPCIATATLADLYPCTYPSGGANAAATPASALTRTAFGSLGLYSGNAGSWNVTQAATVDLTLNYRAAADCTNARVKLIRWNPAVPVTPANPASIVFEQPVALTPTVFSLPGGTFACTGTTNLDGTPCGSYRRAVGSTTVSVPFSHLDSAINATGSHAFGYSFSCNRPGKPRHSGGDLMTFKVSIPVPAVSFSVGGAVSGLTGSGLVLANPGSSNLPIAADGSFTFAPTVGAGSAYAVSVLTQPAGQTCTVVNGSGTANANVTNVAVSCAAVSAVKAWQTAAPLEAAAGQAYSPLLVFDANGSGMAIWNQSDGTYLRIRSRRYVLGSGWGTEMPVDNGGASMALSPKIAADGLGNLMAVWLQPVTASTTSIWTNRYSAGSGWGTATLLADNLSSVGGNNPEIAMDPAGNATVVWYAFDGSWTSLWAKRYTAGGTWDAATLIESDNSGGVSGHRVAMDTNGHAMVVWAQYDSVGQRENVMANRYVVGTGWGTATPIETSNLTANNPGIAVDGAGNMMAVWHQQSSASSSSFFSIYTNRFSGGSWGTASLVKADIPYATQSAIAMNASGNAMLVWLEDDGFDTGSIWARAYTAGAGGAIVRIDNLSVFTDGRSPQVGIDASGNAIALWGQGRFIWSARYAAGVGWAAATNIDNAAATSAANQPRIAVSANGNALAVWERSASTTQDVWANEFK
jgi:ZU5 domain